MEEPQFRQWLLEMCVCALHKMCEVCELLWVLWLALNCIQLHLVDLGGIRLHSVTWVTQVVSFVAWVCMFCSQMYTQRYWVLDVAPWPGAEWKCKIYGNLLRVGSRKCKRKWKCKIYGNLLRVGSSSQTEEPARSDKATAKKLRWKFPDKSLKANVREIGKRNIFWLEQVTHCTVTNKGLYLISEKSA